MSHIHDLVNAQRVTLASLSETLHLAFEAGQTEFYEAVRLRRVVGALKLEKTVALARERGELTGSEAERAMAPIVSVDTAEVFGA